MSCAHKFAGNCVNGSAIQNCVMKFKAVIFLFRFFTAVMMKIQVFWGMTPCWLVVTNILDEFAVVYINVVVHSLDPEDVGSKLLQNVGNC